ncbi:MAG: hypothetical protein ACT4PP_00770 [Sporichthyaceae bacterium]
MRIATRGWSYRLTATIATAALLLAAGCSGEDSQRIGGAGPAPSSTALDLTSYDTIVIASAPRMPLFADLYGIRFSPFVMERITTDKRVSSLGAGPENIVVAAADQGADQLALVGADGTLRDVPGLGRPFGYNPHVADDTLFYEAIEREGEKLINRYFAWDFDRQRQTPLFDYTESLDGITPLSRGRFAFAIAGNDTTEDVVVVRAKNGALTRFGVGGQGIGLDVGRDLIATTLVGAGDRFGDTPETLVLLDRDTGETEQIPGLQAICWTPDGTRLLARRTTSTTSSELVLLDPAAPTALAVIGSVPNLVIYSGAWVRNNP